MRATAVAQIGYYKLFKVGSDPTEATFLSYDGAR
jgi:hypothetical protein